jgi:hypothetical protein
MDRLANTPSDRMAIGLLQTYSEKFRRHRHELGRYPWVDTAATARTSWGTKWAASETQASWAA